MLLAEYDYDTDIAVQRQESFMIGIQQGMQRGKSLGLAEGKSLGLAEGSHQKALQDATNLKRLGVSAEIISKATGLSQEEVNALN